MRSMELTGGWFPTPEADHSQMSHRRRRRPESACRCPDDRWGPRFEPLACQRPAVPRPAAAREGVEADGWIGTRRVRQRS